MRWQISAPHDHAFIYLASCLCQHDLSLSVCILGNQYTCRYIHVRYMYSRNTSLGISDPRTAQGMDKASKPCRWRHNSKHNENKNNDSHNKTGTNSSSGSSSSSSSSSRTSRSSSSGGSSSSSSSSTTTTTITTTTTATTTTTMCIKRRTITCV